MFHKVASNSLKVMQAFPTDDRAKDMRDLDLRFRCLLAQCSLGQQQQQQHLLKDSSRFKCLYTKINPSQEEDIVCDQFRLRSPRISSPNNTLKKETATTLSPDRETSKRQHTPNAYNACTLVPTVSYDIRNSNFRFPSTYDLGKRFKSNFYFCFSFSFS